MENINSYNLILKDLTNEITPEEKKSLDIWLTETPQNRDTYKQVIMLLDKIKPPQDVEFPDINTEWEKLAKSLDLSLDPSPSITRIHKTDYLKTEINQFPKRNLFRYAAAASILIASLILYYWFMAFPQESSNFVSTKNGEIRELSLTEGTQIKLNNASRLEYPNSFSPEERRVILEGEAFFQVSREERPFIVETKSTNVTVLGTKFNIRERDNGTIVTVTEGKVRFSLGDESSNKKIILEMNQMGVATNTDLSGPFDLDDAGKSLGWLQNRIIFDKTGLREAAEELERIYDVKIDVENSVLNSLSISGSFEKKSLDTVLEAICLTLELNYRTEGTGYLIY